MKKYLIMHRTATEHDSIGNDIDIMSELFSGIGQCLVYAEKRINPRLKYVEEKDLQALLTDLDTILIYHHSSYWEKGEKYLRMAAGQKIICYHSVTPPEYPAPYDSEEEQRCRAGREQTLRFARELTDARWLCDSSFNAGELQGIVPRERITVFPPFHRTEDWVDGSPDEKLLKELVFSDKANLLFVGRPAPHRNVTALMEILRIYRENYDDEICLWLLGRQDEGIPAYMEEIGSLIEKYGLKDNVRWMGEVSDETMSAYYLGCDYYISVSDHEGFCVPVAEAQYFKMPLILKNSSSMAEAAGEGAVLLGDDPREFAAAIHVLRTREDYRRYLREKGRENYDKRYNSDWMKQRFKGMLKEWNMV